MNTFPIILFTLLIISSVFIATTFKTSYAEEVIATSLGFEDSTILELKNSRGNIASIDSIRIWLSGENEFKSFKTEQGWLGKKQLNGVIEFTSQKVVNPGESVKIGIKTSMNNPIINWKAVDTNGEVISSASTKVTKSETTETNSELNKPKITTIKEESNFRFIPEKPAANSFFRVIGDNFVPNQILDFYIGDKLEKTVKVDSDGKILFTSQIPDTKNDERTEFILRDAGGSEKTLSIRIPNLENRIIPDEIKLSLGNTPKQVKRGDTMTLTGMATPNTTLTITCLHPNGDIISINTIDVGFDGKWKFDNLFAPELELGTISIEVDDGKNTALRNIEVISSKIINISSFETMYEPGDTIEFEGKAIPNQQMSIIIEDGIGAEIFSRMISVGESGTVNFNFEIPRGAIDGTYLLLAFQGEEEGITLFGVGQEPEPILILRSPELNFPTNKNAMITIQGQSNAQVSLILIDSADREKFSDTINLGPSGRIVYEIDTSEIPTGSYTLNAKRGESTGSIIFTVGLTTGSGTISIQTTRDNYEKGEQILILGNTGAINVLLDVTIYDSSGTVVKNVETFSDRFGVFKIDNFRIPSDSDEGEWIVKAKSGGNFSETKFTVSGETNVIKVETDKESYNNNEIVTISGNGARQSATITIKIVNSEGVQIDRLDINAKNNGEYITIWRIPANFEAGIYNVTVDDGSTNSSTNLTIN